MTNKDAIEALDRIELLLINQFKSALEENNGDTFLEVETIRKALENQITVEELESLKYKSREGTGQYIGDYREGIEDGFNTAIAIIIERVK